MKIKCPDFCRGILTWAGRLSKLWQMAVVWAFAPSSPSLLRAREGKRRKGVALALSGNTLEDCWEAGNHEKPDNRSIRRQYSDTSTVAWPEPSRGGIARESARHGDHEESMIGESLLGMRGSNSTTTMRPRWHCGHSRNVQPVSSSYRSR